VLLVVYAYGTSTGIRAVASGEHGRSEDDLRYVRRRYLNAEVARPDGIATRRTQVWGDGCGAVASDSNRFGAFDQNISPSGIPATAAAAKSSA
jgi:hypothetical protein